MCASFQVFHDTFTPRSIQRLDFLKKVAHLGSSEDINLVLKQSTHVFSSFIAIFNHSRRFCIFICSPFMYMIPPIKIKLFSPFENRNVSREILYIQVFIYLLRNDLQRLHVKNILSAYKVFPPGGGELQLAIYHLYFFQKRSLRNFTHV